MKSPVSEKVFFFPSPSVSHWIIFLGIRVIDCFSCVLGMTPLAILILESLLLKLLSEIKTFSSMTSLLY